MIEAMRAAGINYTGEIIADGKIHRFHVPGHSTGTKNGSYIYYPDEPPAGWFCDFKSGISQSWSASGEPPSQERIEKSKQAADDERKKMQAKAARKASTYWHGSAHAVEHPYLAAKKIKPFGAREFAGALVIPLYNADKALVNLQFINADGTKRFLSGGRKNGCFFPIGEPTDKLLICEGFATGASLRDHTGHCVIVAFDAGNLKPVALEINSLFKGHEIIVCADNDESGVGQKAAEDAALAVYGSVLMPPNVGEDWNDYLSKGNND